MTTRNTPYNTPKVKFPRVAFLGIPLSGESPANGKRNVTNSHEHNTNTARTGSRRDKTGIEEKKC